MELFLPIVLTARFLSNHYCSIGKNAAVFLGGIPASAFKLIRILLLFSPFKCSYQIQIITKTTPPQIHSSWPTEIFK